MGNSVKDVWGTEAGEGIGQGGHGQEDRGRTVETEDKLGGKKENLECGR